MSVDILAIETSCDETACAVVRDGREILSNVIYTQIDMHTEFGGVVPELASRAHIDKINYVVQKALNDAGKTIDEVDAVAVTYGPGLVGALLVGVAEAKAMAWAAGKPIIGVHHIEGHISANYIEHPELTPPYLGLIVSGGHTHLVVVEDWSKYRILGRTVDDAAGEAYDKVYPGGPKIDREAKNGDPLAVHFPIAHVNGSEYDFSFSGIKSAVLNYLNHAQMTGDTVNRADLAASFQKAVVDVLVEHTIRAAKDLKIDRIGMAGGVASNSALRAAMKEACDREGYALYIPSPIFCTDNAAMIGVAAYHEYMAGVRSGWDLNAVPNLKLEER